MMLNRGEEDELYEQLWKACAGSNVEVPRAGQRVFYFPQGHMEQVSFFFGGGHRLLENVVQDAWICCLDSFFFLFCLFFCIFGNFLLLGFLLYMFFLRL